MGIFLWFGLIRLLLKITLGAFSLVSRTVGSRSSHDSHPGCKHSYCKKDILDIHSVYFTVQCLITLCCDGEDMWWKSSRAILEAGPPQKKIKIKSCFDPHMLYGWQKIMGQKA